MIPGLPVFPCFFPLADSFPLHAIPLYSVKPLWRKEYMEQHYPDFRWIQRLSISPYYAIRAHVCNNLILMFYIF